jgi:hypothetical protein
VHVPFSKKKEEEEEEEEEADRGKRGAGFWSPFCFLF